MIEGSTEHCQKIGCIPTSVTLVLGLVIEQTKNRKLCWVPNLRDPVLISSHPLHHRLCGGSSYQHTKIPTKDSKNMYCVRTRDGFSSLNVDGHAQMNRGLPRVHNLYYPYVYIYIYTHTLTYMIL